MSRVIEKQKVYISGMIGTLPEEVFTKNFQDAEDHFAAKGFEVVNPVKLNHDHDKTWASYMLEDLEALIPCHAIAMLPNYINSPGAKIELAFAEKMGKQIYFM